MTRIKLVEQHVIKPNDPRFASIDQAAFASKNLYNLGNYYIRQHFFRNSQALRYETLYHQLKETEAYQALPRKVSQQTLKMLAQNWLAYQAAHKDWQTNPHKYLSEPRIPKYKDKDDGRFVLIYTSQAIHNKYLKKGLIKPSGLEITISTNRTQINQVRIVPKKGYYVVEVVYEVDPDPDPNLDDSLIAGIDLGIDNLATITSNKRGFTPLVVNGRPLKSMNQFYNKRKAELQSQLKGNRYTSRRINSLTNKRNHKVKDYLHKTSRLIIDLLVREGIGTLVIGRNANWKQEVNIGNQNNQNFVQIPHFQLCQMLKYKAELVGIVVKFQEESYTSKCSFLDLEPVGKQVTYLGKRIKRGLFRSADGLLINADCNGAYNIIRKAIPKAFADGIEGIVVCPVRVTPVLR